MKNKIAYLYPLTWLVYSVFSYSQTVPNLVLSSNPTYWSFQQHMWQLGYHMRVLSSTIFLLLVCLLFGLFLYLLRQIKNRQIDIKALVVITGLSVFALLPSYPGLSNDVFNYLMNAKIMHVYHASPYQHAAWDFPDDPWLKFMMNVHTTTPYGFVWTGLGYIVYWLAWGDLQFGMLGFRLLGVLALVVCSISIWRISGKKLYPVGMFCLNPLVLLEGVNNAHNDITMMAFVMAGLAAFSIYQHTRRIRAWILLAGLWILSVYTKLVTVVYPFVYMGYAAIKRRIHKQINFFDLLALLMILAMTADSSKRYYSWYLLWSLPIATIAKSTFIRQLFIVLSFTGLLSYLPYLYTGEYTDYLGLVRYAIFFVPPILYSLGYFLIFGVRKLSHVA